MTLEHPQRILTRRRVGNLKYRFVEENDSSRRMLHSISSNDTKKARDQGVHIAPKTPWKINMEPKNGGLEDDFPLQLVQEISNRTHWTDP